MRYLRPGEYGVLSLLTITLTVVVIILKAGLNHAFFRHYYDTPDSEQRRRIVGSTVLFLFSTSALSCGLLMLVAPQVSAFVFRGDAGLGELVQLIFLISFFEVITLVPDSILRTKFQSVRYSIVSVIALAFQLALIGYLLIWVDSNVKNVLLGRLGGAAFEAALFYLVVRKDLSLSFSLSELKKMLGFGMPLVLGQLAFHLFIMVDRFFLEKYGSEKDVGIYSISNQIVSVVTVLITVPFSQVWTVMRFSVMNEEGAEEYYSRVLTYIVFASMFLALCVGAVAGDGIRLYGLRGYWSAEAIIPLLAMASVLDSASRVLNVGTTLRKRTIFAPLVVGSALLVNVALNFWLIPRYGFLGATWATVISYVVFCALRFWSSNLFIKIQYEWGRVFVVMLVGSATIAGFYLIDYFRDPSGRLTIFFSMALKALLALLFPFILYAVGFYQPRELKRAAEMARQVRSVLRPGKLRASNVLADSSGS